MKVAEFLDKLYDSPRDWFLNEFGSIRRVNARLGSGGACPVFEVAGRFRPRPRLEGPGAVSWGMLMGLADDALPAVPGSMEAKIRAALLHACGLEEVKL